MKDYIKKWDKLAKKQIILTLINPEVQRVYVELRSIEHEDRDKVVEFREYFRSGSDQGLGFYELSEENATKFLHKAIQIKNNLLLDKFAELF